MYGTNVFFVNFSHIQFESCLSEATRRKSHLIYAIHLVKTTFILLMSFRPIYHQHTVFKRRNVQI